MAFHAVDLLGSERFAEMTLVPRLAADLPLATMGSGIGLAGLTMSLDGGLEELEEFFLSRTISA